jgi:hypothetical protein
MMKDCFPDAPEVESSDLGEDEENRGLNHSNEEGASNSK